MDGSTLYPKMELFERVGNKIVYKHSREQISQLKDKIHHIDYKNKSVLGLLFSRQTAIVYGE